MKTNLIDKIESIFKNPQELSISQMESFVHEMLGFFETLRTTLSKGSDEEKKEALATAQEVQQKLQLLAQKAYEKTGMSETEIQKFLSSTNFSKDDWKIFQNARQEIHDYQKNLTPGAKAPFLTV